MPTVWAHLFLVRPFLLLSAPCSLKTGVRAFHLSGKQVLQSRMTFRREGVPMGLPGFSEFEVWQTSEANIRAARQALDSL